ncbi:hypothetical protein Tco_0430760, partial [Tanacetum coccineum]
SPGYIPESDPKEDLEEDDEEDPEEDPADYPADRGDDDDDTEEEHSAPADPAAVAYSADQDPYIAYRITARMSIRPHGPTCVEGYRGLLALPTPPPSPLSPYSSPLRHFLYHYHYPMALHVLRDLGDPELLGLDREMHYHLLFMR